MSTIGQLINSESSLISKNHATWKAVLTLTKLTDGASSQGTQTMVMNVTNLPPDAKYRVYKTTANGGDYFANPKP